LAVRGPTDRRASRTGTRVVHTRQCPGPRRCDASRYGSGGVRKVVRKSSRSPSRHSQFDGAPLSVARRRQRRSARTG
jgi:hypothetical protein